MSAARPVLPELGCSVGGRLVERAKGDDRARGEAVVVELGVALERGVYPVDHRTVASPQLGERIPARSGELEGLEEAVELEALAHPYRHEPEGNLHLAAVPALRDRGQLTTPGRERGPEAERLHQRSAEYACGRPAEEILGRAASNA